MVLAFGERNVGIEKKHGLIEGFLALEEVYRGCFTGRNAEAKLNQPFLGSEEFGSFETDLVKINSDNLEDTMENYQVVAYFLSGTEFVCFR